MKTKNMKLSMVILVIGLIAACLVLVFGVFMIVRPNKYAKKSK